MLELDAAPRGGGESWGDELAAGGAGALHCRPLPLPFGVLSLLVTVASTGAVPVSAGCACWGTCWTCTRKIVDATWRLMKPRSSSYNWNASRLNSLSGSMPA